MLRAEELMVGDWVRVKDCIDQFYYFDEYEPGEIVQVREILDNGINPNWAGAEVSGILGLEDIQPIHLTPEILEKNGFKKLDDGIWPRYVFIADIQKWPQTIIEFTFYGEGVLVETLFKCWTKPECGDGENSIHICDLKHVHQMQHAIRLCGIDKTIEL